MISETSSDSLDSLIAVLPADWEDRLFFLKLKHGVAGLTDPKEVVSELQYYLVFAEGMTEAYLKTVLAAHATARTEKHIKAALVLICSAKAEQELRALGAAVQQDGVIVLVDPSLPETAIWLRGALALIAPLFQPSLSSLFVDSLHCGVPLVTSNQPEISDVVGHAAYFLERVDREEIERALVKLENSSQLRASIQHAAKEFLHRTMGVEKNA